MPLNILIVDDHALFAQGLKMILENMEDGDIHTISVATNSTEVQQVLKQKEIDLVFLDIRMPEKSGADLYHDIKFKYPACKVIVLSMITDAKTVIRLVKQGVNAYVYKNTNPAILYTTIREVRKNEYYFSPDVAAIMAQHVKYPELMQESLTEKESQILRLICEGESYPAIAEKVFLSARTVEGYKMKLFAKTNTANTAGLVVYAIREGYYQV